LEKGKGEVQRKTVKFGLVPPLAANGLVGGDFGNIGDLLSLKVTFS